MLLPGYIDPKWGLWVATLLSVLVRLCSWYTGTSSLLGGYVVLWLLVSKALVNGWFSRLIVCKGMHFYLSDHLLTFKHVFVLWVLIVSNEELLLLRRSCWSCLKSGLDTSTLNHMWQILVVAASVVKLKWLSLLVLEEKAPHSNRLEAWQESRMSGDSEINLRRSSSLFLFMSSRVSRCLGQGGWRHLVKVIEWIAFLKSGYWSRSTF